MAQKCKTKSLKSKEVPRKVLAVRLKIKKKDKSFFDNKKQYVNQFKVKIEKKINYRKELIQAR